MFAKSKLALTIAGTVVVLGGIYIGGSMHYNKRFLPNTTVLGVNVGGKTTTEANSALKTEFKNQTYKLTEGSKTVATATGTDLGISNDFTKTLDTVATKQSGWSWLGALLGGKKAAKVSAATDIDSATVKAYATNLATKLNVNRTDSKSATLSFTDGKLSITKEVQGTKVDGTRLATALTNAVAATKATVNVKTAYAKPAVTVNTPTFKKMKTTLTNITKITGKVTVAGHTVTINHNQLVSWLSYADGKIDVSTSGVTAFVKELNDKYATYQSTRSFKSTKQGTVAVKGGTYGWSINSVSEVASLIAAIKTGKSFTKAAIVNGSGYNTSGTDIGSTYIEVDITNQHEWYYKDGKLVMDSDVVTGKPDGHDTPTGVYYIWKKQRNATLTGSNADGTAYSSPVSYWMPIDYTGVGLHDASWQPKFGGDWYKEHGSHGCVNNPPSFIAKLYDAVEVGTPVVIIG